MDGGMGTQCIGFMDLLGMPFTGTDSFDEFQFLSLWVSVRIFQEMLFG